MTSPAVLPRWDSDRVLDLLHHVGVRHRVARTLHHDELAEGILGVQRSLGNSVIL